MHSSLETIVYRPTEMVDMNTDYAFRLIWHMCPTAFPAIVRRSMGDDKMRETNRSIEKVKTIEPNERDRRPRRQLTWGMAARVSDHQKLGLLEMMHSLVERLTAFRFAFHRIRRQLISYPNKVNRIRCSLRKPT